MRKSELIKALSLKFPSLTMDEIKVIIEMVFGVMSSYLAKGERIELRGFGTMAIRIRKPARLTNPNSKEPMNIGARAVIYYRMGQDLIRSLNPCNDM